MALTKIDDRGLKTPIDLLDNEKIRFGTGNDLELYHDGSHSRIYNQTGALVLRTDNDVFIQSYTGGENIIKGTANGAVELYYDGSKKFETTSVGGLLTGKLEASNGFWCKDNATYRCGDGTDLMIYHDGTDSIISNATNVLKTHSSHLFIRNAAGNEDIAKFVQNGSVELYYDNSKKFATYNGGVEVFGDCSLGDNRVLNIGTGSDLQIYHDGSTNIINGVNGNTSIRTAAAGSSGENAILIVPNGAVELYYDDSRKIRTTSTGIAVDDHIDMDDGHRVRFGTSADFQIYHNGTNNYVMPLNGDIIIDNGSGELARISQSGAVSDSKGNLRDIPFNSNAGAYTLVASDAGKVVGNQTGGWTIPNSVFTTTGMTVTILNESSSDQVLDASALVYLFNTADGANVKASTLTLGARSMATIWFSAHNVAYIQASALTVS